MAAPCALVVSCCSAVKPEDLLKQIFGRDDLPASEPITDGIVGYPWCVDNKYYTANVQLCTSPQKTIGNQQFAENLEAIVIACSDQKASFESVKQWLPFVQQLNPEIMILACEQFSKSKEISRDETAVWCLDHSFELVELQLPEDEEDDQDEFDIIGTKRIVSALHAHMWPNLQMKEETPFHHRNLDNLSDIEDNNSSNTTHSNSPHIDHTNVNSKSEEEKVTDDKILPSQDTNNKCDDGDSNTASTSNISSLSQDVVTNSNTEDKTSCGGDAACASTGEDKTKGDRQTREEKSREERIESLLGEDMKLFEALGNDDPGEESFESLFSRMAVMKERAASLPEEDRRQYAEKVAIAFWRAMGGDEAEVDGLDEEESD